MRGNALFKQLYLA
jgi:hypothetical protein